MSDANAAKRRSVQWLLAAKAIVAAEKADSALALEEAKAVAAAHLKRLEYLQREALYLASAKKSASQPRGDCHRGLPGGDRRGNPHCQFASYVDSWNEGRIPAQVLEYRPVQIGRGFAVRRARAVALKQHALASAGAATLKDHGAGGLTAALIAQACSTPQCSVSGSEICDAILTAQSPPPRSPAARPPGDTRLADKPGCRMS